MRPVGNSTHQMAVFFFLLLVAARQCPAQPPDLEAARRLLDNGQPRQALVLLQKGHRAETSDTATIALMARAYEALGDIDAAINLYTRAASRGDAAPEARKQVLRLVEAGFPRWIRDDELMGFLQLVGEGPLRVHKFDISLNQSAWPPMTNDRVQVFVTVGPLFTPSSHRVDPLHRRPDGQLPDDAWRFARVCYGYAHEPERRRWELAFRVMYLSPLMSSRDWGPLARGVCAELLRLRAHSHWVLGVHSRFLSDGVTDVWLTTGGSPGGELPPPTRSSIYFYAIDDPDRDDFEWLRQIAHEYGHLMMPAIDGYAGVEDAFLGDDIGERLYLKWLVQSALASPATGNTSVRRFSCTPQRWRDFVATRIADDWRELAVRGLSPALAEDHTRRGMRYALGLLDFLEATCGPRTVGRVLRGAAERAPASYADGSDILAAFTSHFTASAHYIQIRPASLMENADLAWRAPFRFDSADSRLPLTGGGRYAGAVYLPAGRWSLTLKVATSATCEIRVTTTAGGAQTVTLTAQNPSARLAPIAVNDGLLRFDLHALAAHGGARLESIEWERWTPPATP